MCQCFTIAVVTADGKCNRCWQDEAREKLIDELKAENLKYEIACDGLEVDNLFLREVLVEAKKLCDLITGSPPTTMIKGEIESLALC